MGEINNDKCRNDLAIKKKKASRQPMEMEMKMVTYEQP